MPATRPGRSAGPTAVTAAASRAASIRRAWWITVTKVRSGLRWLVAVVAAMTRSLLDWISH